MFSVIKSIKMIHPDTIVQNISVKFVVIVF